VALTQRHLASGTTYRNIKDANNINCKVVLEVVEAILD
jgi:hypothetical protein